MVMFMKKSSKKAGLPPGTLVHIGEKRTAKVRIRVIVYNEENVEERELESVEECSSKCQTSQAQSYRHY